MEGPPGRSGRDFSVPVLPESLQEAGLCPMVLPKGIFIQGPGA